MPNTDSADHILATVRTRLLTFVPLTHPATGTRTIAQLLGTATGAGSDGKMYKNAPPDPVSYPYSLIRNSSFPNGDDGGYQIRGEIELEFFGFPRTQAANFGGVTLGTGVAISAMADIAEQAWRDYVALAVNDTLVAKRIAIRNEVPFTNAADRELVLIRMRLPYYATPAYQAVYSAPHT